MMCIIQLKFEMNQLHQHNPCQKGPIHDHKKQNGMLLEQKLTFTQKGDSMDFQRNNHDAGHSRVESQPESDFKPQQWTLTQEQRLLELHNQKGNRWVQIARELRRNDNAVKNHYHSRLRKTLRKLNKCISDHLKGSFRPLKNSIISKIIQTAEECYHQKENEPTAFSKKAFDLKNKILAFVDLSQQQTSQVQIKQIRDLIIELQEFSQELKQHNKALATSKNGSSKYKGKQIISLLNENQRKTAQASSQAVNCRRSLTFMSSDDEGPEDKANKHQEKKAEEKTTISYGLNSSPTGQTPMVFFNDPMMQFQQMYFPLFNQTSQFHFSGRTSSFTSVHSPQLPRSQAFSQWPSWQSMSHIGVQKGRKGADQG